MKLQVSSSPEPRKLGATAFSRSVTVSPAVAQSLAGAIALPLQGPPGPQGPSGTSGAGYVYTQSVPSSTWTIAHNLGFYPSVTVASTGGVEVEAEVAHISTTLTEIRFLIPFTGTARLS